MRFIPTKIHGFLDYLIAIVLFIIPWLPGFNETEAAQAVSLGAGVVLLITSFTTRYEPGFLSIIPMPLNLTLDTLIGVILAASPWIFGFAHQLQIPYLFLGGSLIVMSIFTKKGSRFQRSFTFYLG
jgi:hypothetical protein